MLSSTFLNEVLNRNEIKMKIIDILKSFEQYPSNITKKGIYIHGSSGCGKSNFIKNILKEMEYDVILYDAGDVRNKSLFHNIDNNHVSNRNVLDLMNRKQRKIAIIMDEIDAMNNGDKGGIDALIKLIRQKKTKKQKLENTTANPIICIGNNEKDKKIKELMKVCHTFELLSPNQQEISKLLEHILPPFYSWSCDFKQDILNYIQGDLRKLIFLQNLWNNKPELVCPNILNRIFHVKMYNEDTKTITWKLFHKDVDIKEHNVFMNETDRTTVALLWHENIGSVLSKFSSDKSFPFYTKLLDNMCFADYIGRITFQSQIWQFNEMTSLIKTFHNNSMFHKTFDDYTLDIPKENIEFTKVLTKYSTEYNNQLFLHNITQKINLDKKDIIAFFNELRMIYGENYFLNTDNNIIEELQRFNIDILDIKRMYRFLDKNGKKDEIIIVDESDEGD